MVMAAGLGKRMRPLTATRPKPLVRGRGQGRCSTTASTGSARRASPRAVVNVHYLADALEAHLKSRVKGIEIAVSDEREQLLETGGGLAHALPLIDADPFLVVNSATISGSTGRSTVLRLLASGWDDARMDALLLLVPLARANCHSGQGDFHMSATGQLRRKSPARSRRSSIPASR